MLILPQEARFFRHAPTARFWGGAHSGNPPKIYSRRAHFHEKLIFKRGFAGRR
jgi:hypothetical protein